MEVFILKVLRGTRKLLKRQTPRQVAEACQSFVWEDHSRFQVIGYGKLRSLSIGKCGNGPDCPILTGFAPGERENCCATPAKKRAAEQLFRKPWVRQPAKAFPKFEVGHRRLARGPMPRDVGLFDDPLNAHCSLTGTSSFLEEPHPRMV